MANLTLHSPIPSIPLANAPSGVSPLVRGSQIGAVIGGGMGLEKTIQDAQDEGMPLPKAIAKGALNVAGGATLGTLTGLSGGVLLNRVRGVNNTDALNYANKYVFGEPNDGIAAQLGILQNDFKKYKRQNAFRLLGVGVGAGVTRGVLQKQINDLHGTVSQLSEHIPTAIADSGQLQFMKKHNSIASFVAIPTRITSLQPVERAMQAPLSYTRKLGLGLGVVKGATEQSDNILEPEVSPMDRLYKIGTNALGGYIAGDLGGRVYNNRAAIASKIKVMKNDALARMPQVNVTYN
jgi:hypothetical protein